MLPLLVAAQNDRARCRGDLRRQRTRQRGLAGAREARDGNELRRRRRDDAARQCEVVARASEREAIEAASAGAPFTGLFLAAGLDTRIARIGGRVGDASDADAAVARAQEAYDLGSLDWTRVDASGTPADTLARALAVLQRG
jgi:hypothetical protein